MKNWQKILSFLFIFSLLVSCGGPKQKINLSNCLNESLKKSSHKDYKRAIQLLNLGAEAYPLSADIFYNRGMNKLALKQWQAAEDDLARARDLYKKENNRIAFDMSVQTIQNLDKQRTYGSKKTNFMANLSAFFKK